MYNQVKQASSSSKIINSEQKSSTLTSQDITVKVHVQNKMASARDHNKEALTCGLCKDILTDPRILQCMHVYCLKCLHSLVEKSKLQGECFNCPECRLECIVPQEGVGEFKVSPTISFLVDAYKDSNQTQEAECNACCDTQEKYTPATAQCLDCNKKLCATCRKLHDLFSQGHKVLDLTGDEASDLQTALQSIKERNVFCEKHPTKPIELFCKVDKTVLCYLCYTIDHAGHTCEDIKETAVKNIKPIGAVITQGKGLIDMYEEAIKEMQAYKCKLEKNAENVIAAVNYDMFVLMQAIRVKCKSYIELVNKEKESNVKQVMSHIGHLELHKAIIDGQVNKYCTMVEHGHPVEIAGLGGQINKMSEKWAKQPKLHFNSRIDIKFTDGKVNEDIVQFGVVQIENIPAKDELKPLCVEYKKLQDHLIFDITFTQAGEYVTLGAWGGTCKIYDRNFKLRKDKGEHFYNVTMMSDHSLAFTDESNTIRIHLPDGTHKRDIVCKGSSELWGTAMNKSSGNLLVCDRGTKKNVYHIDPTTGDTVYQYPPGTFKDPLYVTCNSKGVILVCDWGANCIIGLAQEGNEVFSYGEKGDGDQQLSNPHGICTDTGDFIFVADYGNDRVHLLSPEGDFIKYVLTKKDGLSRPYAVAIHDGKLLVGDNTGKLFIVKYRE